MFGILKYFKSFSEDQAKLKKENLVQLTQYWFTKKFLRF